jgi:hypothetical protein
LREQKIADTQACIKRSIMAKEYQDFLERFNCEENGRPSLKGYGPKG